MVRKVGEEFGKLDIYASNARPEVSAFFRSPLDITLEQWYTAFDSQTKSTLAPASRPASSPFRTAARRRTAARVWP
jgi:hypothetical protein